MGLLAAIKTYREVKDGWEDICDCCGLCCRERELMPDGEVVVCYSDACEFLDEETNRCTVYESRFEKCSRCRKVTLWRALFDKCLPPSCAYARLFR